MKLEPGKEYTLKHSGEFCHHITSNNLGSKLQSGEYTRAIFIGSVYLTNSECNRNIFIVDNIGNPSYLMYSDENIDYIVGEEDNVKREFAKSKKMEETLKELKEILNTL